MESVEVAVFLLLCAIIQITGANTERILMPSVIHGIKGRSLHIPVQPQFEMNKMEFQGSWSKTSPQHCNLVNFNNGSVIHDLRWKDMLTFNPATFSLTLKQLDEAAEGDYQLEVNIKLPGQKKREPLTITKNVSVTVNVNLPPPVVHKSSEGTLMEDQDNVTLTCIVENNAKAWYQWLKNNKPIRPREHHVLSQNNNTLLINPVKKEDIGMYSCVIKNFISQAQSKPMELSVFYGPYNLEVNSDQGLRIGEVFTVNQGELIFFDCLADSNPPNTCVWISRTDNNTEVLMTGSRFEVPLDKFAWPTKFLCRAFNNITKKQDERHFTLVVANLGKGHEKLHGESGFSPLAAITISSLLIILCMLFVLFRKSCHPKRVLMKIYSRPIPEPKGLHRSGHEDATEDFGIYEFVSIPGKMESNHPSCRSLARLDSVRDLHTTIYDVIRHVPETPTLGLLK